MDAVLILNGPNLNRLGTREPELYGTTTLPELEESLRGWAKRNHLRVECFQSNAEHELVERIQLAEEQGYKGIIINPGGLTHTSVVLRDALLGVRLPFIEVHISNPLSRESFRRDSFLADVATGVILGLGVQGYELALIAMQARLTRTASPSPGD